MSNPVTFHWETYERRVPPMPRIIKKVKFKHQVITERNQVWAYVIENKKPRYYFLYHFATEPVINPYAKQPKYMSSTDVLAVKKAIQRHKRKIGETTWLERVTKLQNDINISHLKLRNAVNELKKINKF